MNFQLQTSNIQTNPKIQFANIRFLGFLFSRLIFVLKFEVWILMLMLSISTAQASYPQRIVCGMPAITEMLFAISAGDQVVGVTTNCNYPPEVKRKQKVGGFFLNLEKVVSLKPDLIIMQEDAQKKEIKHFRDYGLPVYPIKMQSVNEVMDTMLAIGERIGKKKEAQRAVREMKDRLEKVKKSLRSHRPALAEVLSILGRGVGKRQALVMVGYDPLVVAGRGTFVDDILEKAGVENVAKEAKSAYPQYSFEKLVAENPQYIIIPRGLVSQKEIQNSKRWNSLEAVRNKRILFMDQDILSRPGPRVISAIEKIVEFVY